MPLSFDLPPTGSLFSADSESVLLDRYKFYTGVYWKMWFRIYTHLESIRMHAGFTHTHSVYNILISWCFVTMKTVYWKQLYHSTDIWEKTECWWRATLKLTIIKVLFFVSPQLIASYIPSELQSNESMVRSRVSLDNNEKHTTDLSSLG